MEGLFSMRGGLMIGKSYFLSGNVSWPLAKLTLTRDSIKIKALFIAESEFKKYQIEKIEIYKPFIFSGIRIHHKRKEVSPFLVFWGKNNKKLVFELMKRGWPVV